MKALLIKVSIISALTTGCAAMEKWTPEQQAQFNQGLFMMGQQLQNNSRPQSFGQTTCQKFGTGFTCSSW